MAFEEIFSLVCCLGSGYNNNSHLFFEKGDLSRWPHPKEDILQIVRVRLSNGQASLLDKFQELKVRANVVRQLSLLYLRRRWRTLQQNPGLSKIHEVQRCETPYESLVQHVVQRIEEHYPEELHNAEGAIIPELRTIVAAQDIFLPKTKEESAFEMKQSTMPDVPASTASIFQEVRPTYVAPEATTNDAFTHDVLSDKTLKDASTVASLDIPMENKFRDQFNAKYFSDIFPYALNYACGGPNYLEFWAQDDSVNADGVRDAWRRVAGEAMLLPAMFTQMLATRPEAQIAGDWTLVPAARNLQWRYEVLRACFLTCKQNILLGEDLNTNLEELFAALGKIFQRMQKGTIISKGKRKPIAGNPAVLFQADDLTLPEKTILQAYLKVTKNIAGCQAIRQRIGHCLFGMRVVLGEAIFVTFSPNRRNSSLVCRLSRQRPNDVSLTASKKKGNEEIEEYRRRHCGTATPKIFCSQNLEVDPDGTATIQEICLPSLPARQALNAQDPLSSVYHYLVCAYVILPAVFGTRMCFRCPDCNYDENDPTGNHTHEHCSCQDLLGSNAKLLGGYAGVAQGLAFATEFQGDGTPHGHGFVSLANAYQHSSLEDIAKLIKKNVHGLCPEDMLSRIVAFQEHLQREDHFDDEGHQANIKNIEKEFHANNAGEKRSIFLCTRPRFAYEADAAPYMFNPKGCLDDCSLWERAQTEAQEFQQKYEKDVQFIFSRVQHHWHILNEKGERVPMKYCRPKNRKSLCGCCTRGFPKKVLRDRKGKIRPDKYRARIVCKGVAAELNLKVSGRRNMLGSIAGQLYI